VPSYAVVLRVRHEDENEPASIAWAGQIEADNEQDAEYIAARNHFHDDPHSFPVDAEISILKEKEEKEKK